MSFQRNRLALIIVIRKFYRNILHTDNIDLRKPGIAAHRNVDVGIIGIWKIGIVRPVRQRNTQVHRFPAIFTDILQFHIQLALLVIGKDGASGVRPVCRVCIRIIPADIPYIRLGIPAVQIVPFTDEADLRLIGYRRNEFIITVHHISGGYFMTVGHT